MKGLIRKILLEEIEKNGDSIDGNLKKSLFSLWEEKGVGVDDSIYRYFGLDLDSANDNHLIRRLKVGFLGGFRNASMEVLKKLNLNEPRTIVDGGYRFTLIPRSMVIMDYDTKDVNKEPYNVVWEVECDIPEGSVDLHLMGKRYTLESLFSKKTFDEEGEENYDDVEELLYEVENEITDTLYEYLSEIFYEYGLGSVIPHHPYKDRWKVQNYYPDY